MQKYELISKNHLSMIDKDLKCWLRMKQKSRIQIFEIGL